MSPQRALALSTALVPRVRSCARSLAMLAGVAGVASSRTAVRRVGRQPGRTGHRGRPRLVLESGVRLGHVVTRDVRRRVVSGARRVVRGTAAAIGARLAARGGAPASLRPPSRGSRRPFAGPWRPWCAADGRSPTRKPC